MCWFREVYYFTFLRSGQKKKRLTASNVEAFIDRNSSRTLQDALAERLKTRELRYPSSLPRTCRIQTESVRGKLHVSPRARTRRAIGPRQDYQESYESNLARRCIPRGAPRGGTSYPSSESGTRRYSWFHERGVAHVSPCTTRYFHHKSERTHHAYLRVGYRLHRASLSFGYHAPASIEPRADSNSRGRERIARTRDQKRVLRGDASGRLTLASLVRIEA